MEYMDFEKQKLQLHRKSLPIYPYRDQILQAVDDHKVLVIAGEPGSGKSTQIPQYLYEAGYTNIVCTQPYRITTMSLAARVSQEMGVKLGQEVGYAADREECYTENTVIKYMMDNFLVYEFLCKLPNRNKANVVILDEAHLRTLDTDILMRLFKDIVWARPHMRLIICSATCSDALNISSYLDNAPILRILPRLSPVEIQYAKAAEANYLDAAINAALQIHVTEPLGGDILVFLTCEEDIESAEEILSQKTQGLGQSGIAKLIICPIYRGLTVEMQAKIFAPAPEGARKVVLDKGLGETSIVIDGIKYVVDTGFCKKNFYDVQTGLDRLQLTCISKASAQQRAARAGQTGPGKCLRLYTANNYKDMEDDIMPQAQMFNRISLVFALRQLGINSFYGFDFEDLGEVIASLVESGVLDFQLVLTTKGKNLREFSLPDLAPSMTSVAFDNLNL